MDKLIVTVGGISEESSGTVWQVLLKSRIGSRRQKWGPFLRALWKKKHSQHEAVAISLRASGKENGEQGLWPSITFGCAGACRFPPVLASHGALNRVPISTCRWGEAAAGMVACAVVNLDSNMMNCDLSGNFLDFCSQQGRAAL